MDYRFYMTISDYILQKQLDFSKPAATGYPPVGLTS